MVTSAGGYMGTYEAQIELCGVPDENGILIDYGVIADIWAPLHVALDHRHLNEIPGLEKSTTENLVAWLVERLRPAFRAYPNVYEMRIRVAESSTTWARSTWCSIVTRETT